MRVCIVGAGIAGATLAWRFGAASGVQVDLVARGGPDATAESGGGVRAYEVADRPRELATASLAELLASPLLQDWSGYRPIGSTFLRAPWGGASADLARIDAAVPGSVHLADVVELRRAGWAGFDDGEPIVGVVETRAGHIDPAAFRAALLRELTAHPRVRLLTGSAVPVAGENPTVRVAAVTEFYDAVVLAAGAWTPALLDDGYGPAAAAGFRVKGIQCAVHAAAGPRPTFFVDELTGLYGRPVGTDAMMFGVPVPFYGDVPGEVAPDPAQTESAAALLARRRPELRLGPPRRVVRSADSYVADSYAEPGTLLLRPVPGHPGVHTFSAGSGGSAKTVLAASDDAMSRLLADPGAPPSRTAAHP